MQLVSLAGATHSSTHPFSAEAAPSAISLSSAVPGPPLQTASYETRISPHASNCLELAPFGPFDT